MVTYLIKVILFSALLLVIYRLFLEKEKIHRFKRFYLLLSIVLPIAIPLVPIQTGSPFLSAFEPVITAWDKPARSDRTGAVAEISKDAARSDNYFPAMDDHEIHYPVMMDSAKDYPAIDGGENQKLTSAHPGEDYTSLDSYENENLPPLHPGKDHAPVEDSEYHDVKEGLYNHGIVIDMAGESFSAKNNRVLGNTLLFAYLAVTTGLIFRFSKNIHAFSKKVRKNRSVPYYEAKLVLTSEGIIPYSFLKYIFVNEDDYKNGAIEPAVLGHELTHIRQKHTLDILLFELVRIIGWINPFLPLYRNALRLNHEFLADESAVKKYCDTVTYQHLLIKKASQGPGMALSSPLNYLFLKKRLVMLNKKGDSKRAILKQVALIPLTGLVSMLFLNITVASGYGGGAGPEGGISDYTVSESSSPQQQNLPDTTFPEVQPPPFPEDFIPAPPSSADIKASQQRGFLVFIDGYMQNSSILDYYEESDFAHHYVRFNNIEDHATFVYFLTHEYYQRQQGSQPEKLLPPGNGVSEQLLDEYDQIISRYTPENMSGGEQFRNIRENISSIDRSRLEEIYLQMSVEQRREQRFIFQPYPVFSRSIPSVIQFDSFKDPRIYGVWIDGNRVDNSVLDNYTNTDFARFSISTLMKNAAHYGKYVYQLDLMTIDYFEEIRDYYSSREGYMLMHRISAGEGKASGLQPGGTVQPGNISWEMSARTDASGNEFNEIAGVFEGTMKSKDIDEAPLKVKIFVTNRKGGEMFTEFYEAGSESPANLYPQYPNLTRLIVYSRLPSGEIIEYEQTSGGSHMWDFYIKDVTPAGSSSRYGEPREGDFLNFILEQDEIMNITVQLHPAEHKTYHFEIDPTGLKELFVSL